MKLNLSVSFVPGESFFHTLTREQQVKYLKKHPGSKFTMKDVKKRGADKKKRKARTDKEADTNNNTKQAEVDSKLEDKLAKKEDSTTKEERKEKAKKLENKKFSKKDADDITNQVKDEFKSEKVEHLYNTVEALKNIKNGKKLEKKHIESSLKVLTVVMGGALLVAGAAAVFATGGLGGLVLAKSFLGSFTGRSSLSSNSSTDRYDEDISDLVHKALNHIENLDNDEIADLIKESEEMNK